MKKRGDYDIVTLGLVILVGLLFVLAVVFPGVLRLVLGIRETTYFEKTFLVGDMAITTNTLYSGPGNIMATYDKDTLWFSYKFDKEGVSSFDIDPERKIKYPIVHTGLIKFNEKLLEPEFFSEPKSEDNLKKKVKPIFAKISDEIIIDEQISRSINEIKCENLEPMGKKTILVDAGHGGEDEGIVIGSLKEKDMTGSIGLVLYQSIKGDKFFTRDNIASVRDQVRKSEYNTKEKTTEEVNKNGIEMIISIHAGSRDDLSNNVKAYYSIESDEDFQQKSKKLGCEILNELVRKEALEITGISVVGINPEDYEGGHILVKDKIAILLEIGNLDNEKSANTLMKSVDIIGNSIIEGIENVE